MWEIMAKRREDSRLIHKGRIQCRHDEVAVKVMGSDTRYINITLTISQQ